MRRSGYSALHGVNPNKQKNVGKFYYLLLIFCESCQEKFELSSISDSILQYKIYEFNKEFQIISFLTTIYK